MKNHKRGFSIAEALVTMMIISLILAAVLPVMSRRNLTNDSMWRYSSSGTGANSNIFYGLGVNQTALLGLDVLPADTTTIPAGTIAPYKSRLVVVTPIDNLNDTIHRSLIDFYQRNTTTDNTTTNIGKISFDTKRNVGIGTSSLLSNTTGTNNTAIGLNALNANTTGSSNIAIGNLALKSANGATDFNTAIGYMAATSTTTGPQNTAVGYQAMSSNTTGSSNVALGAQSIATGTTGSSNTAIGTQSLMSNTGSLNTGVGALSAIYNTGSNNVAIGSGAMKGVSGTSNGSWNTALGYQAGYNITSGTNNLCIGANAGPAAGNGALSGLLYIETNPAAAYSGANALVYGDFVNRTIKFNGATSIAGNFIVTGAGTYTINGSPISTSDRRRKNVFGNNNVGIEKLNKIQPKNYIYKKDKTKRMRVGVIAQDLQKVFPNSVVKMPDGYLGVDTNEMFYAMLNSIKDMYKELQNLIAKVAGLDTRITTLEKENTELKTQLVQINARLDKLEHKK